MGTPENKAPDVWSPVFIGCLMPLSAPIAGTAYWIICGWTKRATSDLVAAIFITVVGAAAILWTIWQIIFAASAIRGWVTRKHGVNSPATTTDAPWGPN